jgi:glycosyltransferase involved in cell wall biosynthesis
VEPFLTIGVPTRGRARRLERLLRALEAQREAGVHVLVSDNASPDETAEVIAAFPWAESHRQPEDVGAVENARWVCANARGQYVWLFGDDDVPAPGAVAEVLGLLRDRRPRWLHLPHSWLRDDGTLVGESELPPAVEEYAGSGHLYRRYHHWLTFISAQVLDAEAMRRTVASARVRGCFAPLAWYFLAALDGRCVVADRRHVVGAGETSWDERRAEILTRDYVTLYEDALHLGVSRADFGRSLDRLYRDGLYFDCWQARPLEELADAVGAFPESRQLRRFLWAIARERDRRDCLGALDTAAARRRARELVSEGERRFSTGDAEGAARAFARAIEELPTLPAAWNDLGVALHSLGRGDAAAALETALWLDPHDTDARANLAAVA